MRQNVKFFWLLWGKSRLLCYLGQLVNRKPLITIENTFFGDLLIVRIDSDSTGNHHCRWDYQSAEFLAQISIITRHSRRTRRKNRWTERTLHSACHCCCCRMTFRVFELMEVVKTRTFPMRKLHIIASPSELSLIMQWFRIYVVRN